MFGQDLNVNKRLQPCRKNVTDPFRSFMIETGQSVGVLEPPALLQANYLPHHLAGFKVYLLTRGSRVGVEVVSK